MVMVQLSGTKKAILFSRMHAYNKYAQTSPTTSNNFQPSPTISNHLKQFPTISNNFQPPQTISNHLKLPQLNNHRLKRPQNQLDWIFVTAQSMIQEL
jgi:hypothetical protein